MLAARAEDLPTPDVVARLASARSGDALLSAAAWRSSTLPATSPPPDQRCTCTAGLSTAASSVRELTGPDLRNGEDRLLLHVALRIARLQRST
jgi:hypothetical protein